MLMDCWWFSAGLCSWRRMSDLLPYGAHCADLAQALMRQPGLLGYVCIYPGSVCWAGWSSRGGWSRIPACLQQAAGPGWQCCRASGHRYRSSPARHSAGLPAARTFPAARAATALTHTDIQHNIRKQASIMYGNKQ